MQSTSPALVRAIGARLVAAFAAAAEVCPWVVNPKPGRALPYGVLGTDTQNDGFSNKSTEGSIVTHTLRIYTASDAQARRFAEIAIADLTNRSNRLTLAAPFYQAGRTGLDLNEIVPDRDERGEVYGALIRFRFRIGQLQS